ncbi:hypothetical protein [Roseibium algae]|uniref:Uncharacterized protein n=1 Tax=Roseibium algae TaxID=3123038 RepID=A0ABU8TM62_9HYPH
MNDESKMSEQSSMTGHQEKLQIVGPKDKFPKVTLVEPTQSGYLFLALEVDHRPPVGFFVESQRKKTLIKNLKALARQLLDSNDVLEATVFKAMIVPPGRGALLKDRPEVNIARFDVTLLVEFTTPEAAQSFASSVQWQEALTSADKLASKSITVTASNARRIGPVDHSRDGVFLFNYFYADSLDLNLQVWNYTAGWFEDQTGLDNSTLLLPDPKPGISYTIINHCRWDRLRDILPALLFNRTFRSFVLANFQKNNTAAMPILYRLA